jgi:hypothetical protein
VRSSQAGKRPRALAISITSTSPQTWSVRLTSRHPSALLTYDRVTCTRPDAAPAPVDQPRPSTLSIKPRAPSRSPGGGGFRTVASGDESLSPRSREWLDGSLPRLTLIAWLGLAVISFRHSIRRDIQIPSSSPLFFHSSIFFYPEHLTAVRMSLRLETPPGKG